MLKNCRANSTLLLLGQPADDEEITLCEWLSQKKILPLVALTHSCVLVTGKDVLRLVSHVTLYMPYFLPTPVPCSFVSRLSHASASFDVR